MVRLNLALLAVLIACALSLVMSRHQARKLFVELEAAHAASRNYETEYGQLQLEQSTWAMPARTEKIAREQLKMQMPGAARVEVVATGRSDILGAARNDATNAGRHIASTGNTR
jgi:cell division protein FtsL